MPRLPSTWFLAPFCLLISVEDTVKLPMLQLHLVCICCTLRNTPRHALWLRYNFMCLLAPAPAVCIPGYGIWESSACTPCNYGWYHPGGDTRCTQCPVATFYPAVDGVGDPWPAQGKGKVRKDIQNWILTKAFIWAASVRILSLPCSRKGTSCCCCTMRLVRGS
jgi:hypothetical protein